MIQDTAQRLYGQVVGHASEGIELSEQDIRSWLERQPELTTISDRIECIRLASELVVHWKGEYSLKSTELLDAASEQEFVHADVAAVLGGVWGDLLDEMIAAAA